MAQNRTTQRASKQGIRGFRCGLKKINFRMNELNNVNFYYQYFDTIRLMFMDESLFGRITTVRSCWCPKGMRPVVSSLKVREYVYAYSAIDPINGDSCFVIAGNCNTDRTNLFLRELSNKLPNDYILPCQDRASWHTSKSLQLPHQLPCYFAHSFILLKTLCVIVRSRLHFFELPHFDLNFSNPVFGGLQFLFK